MTSDVGLGKSCGLAFADGYRDDLINPADDEILSDVARGIKKRIWKFISGTIRTNLRKLFASASPMLGLAMRGIMPALINHWG